MDNETTCAGGFAYVRFGVSGVHPKAFGPRDIGPHLFKQLEEEDITTSGFSLECSGTELCHFTARKFLPEARGVLLDHLRFLLTDTYRPANEYPAVIQSILRDVLDNGTILNSSPEKEKARQVPIRCTTNTNSFSAYTNTQACIHVSLFLSIYLSIYIYIYRYLCISLSLSSYLSIYIHIYIHIYIYIYIYIYML